MTSTVSPRGALASVVSLHATGLRKSDEVYTRSPYSTPNSPASSSVGLPLSPTSSRRPSEIRRKPVPRLSDAEQQLLTLHDNSSGRLSSLGYQRSSASTASLPGPFHGTVSRRLSVAQPLQTTHINAKDSPSSFSFSTSALPIVVSRNPSLTSNISSEAVSNSTTPAYSSPLDTPLAAIDATAYRFPLPPVPASITWASDYSPVAPAASQQDAVASPRKSSIPPDVMEDCGFSPEEAACSSDLGRSSQSADEQLDALGELSLSTGAVSNAASESVRLSNYRWQAGSKRFANPSMSGPHSRSETQDTDVFPSGVTTRTTSHDGTFGRSASVSSQVSASPSMSSISSSLSSGHESIFDSYGDQQGTDEVVTRHGSLASTDTNISLATALGAEDETPAKNNRNYYIDERRDRQLSTVGEEQSMRAREDSFAQVYDRTMDSIDVGAYGSSKSAYSSSSGTPSSSASSSPSRTERKQARKQAKKQPFSQFAKPTTEQLSSAADAMVYNEQGGMIRFGDLWEGQRTIVCFIRHYWCPSCQDYMASIMRITPEQLRTLNLRLIVVGCGNWKMISGYRTLLDNCPFPIVSDPTRAIYRQFGMTRTTMAPGAKPEYVQHGMTVNTLISLKRNLAMPLKDPGELNGLGGEFVLGPRLECTYAHRMKTTRDHAELQDILKALGVMLPHRLANQLTSPAAGGAPAQKKHSLTGRGGEGKVAIRLAENQD